MCLRISGLFLHTRCTIALKFLKHVVIFSAIYKDTLNRIFYQLDIRLGVFKYKYALMFLILTLVV